MTRNCHTTGCPAPIGRGGFRPYCRGSQLESRGPILGTTAGTVYDRANACYCPGTVLGPDNDRAKRCPHLVTSAGPFHAGWIPL